MYYSKFHNFSPEKYQSVISISREICHETCHSFGIDSRPFVYRCFCCSIIVGAFLVHLQEDWENELYDHIRLYIHRHLYRHLKLNQKCNKTTQFDTKSMENYLHDVEAIFIHHKNKLDTLDVLDDSSPPKDERTLGCELSPNLSVSFPNRKENYKTFELLLSQNLSVDVGCLSKKSIEVESTLSKLMSYALNASYKTSRSVSPSIVLPCTRNNRILGCRFKKSGKQRPLNARDLRDFCIKKDKCIEPNEQTIHSTRYSSTSNVDAEDQFVSTHHEDELVHQITVSQECGNLQTDALADIPSDEGEIKASQNFDMETQLALEEKQNAQFSVAKRKISFEDVELGSDFADAALRKALSASEQMRKRQPIDPDFFQMEQAELHIEPHSMRIERYPRNSSKHLSQETNVIDPIICQLSLELLELTDSHKPKPPSRQVQSDRVDSP